MQCAAKVYEIGLELAAAGQRELKAAQVSEHQRMQPAAKLAQESVQVVAATIRPKMFLQQVELGLKQVRGLQSQMEAPANCTVVRTVERQLFQHHLQKRCKLL
jgi:hypothetical protein